jgi:cytochrome c biogenesis protein CcmG/thiol:disulfide interchange protein DsbE
VLALAFQHDPHRIPSPLVGRAAPAFSLEVLGGGTRTLADLRGKPAVLNFWATWCVPCQDEHPLLVQAARFYDGRVGFAGIVYQDDPSTISAWLGKHGGEGFPTLIDDGGRTAIAYGVYGVPETFVLDATGTIAEKFTGPVSPPRLRELLDSLVPAAGEIPPAPGPSSVAAVADYAAIVGPPATSGLAGAALVDRTREVGRRVRCPTCQGVAVADSPSATALAMREEVRAMLAQGYDQEQILLYFEASYGEFIRLDPRADGLGWLPWAAPIVFVLAGGVVVVRGRGRGAERRTVPPAEAGADIPAHLVPYLDRVRRETRG